MCAVYANPLPWRYFKAAYACMRMCVRVSVYTRACVRVSLCVRIPWSYTCTWAEKAWLANHHSRNRNQSHQRSAVHHVKETRRKSASKHNRPCIRSLNTTPTSAFISPNTDKLQIIKRHITPRHHVQNTTHHVYVTNQTTHTSQKKYPNRYLSTL